MKFIGALCIIFGLFVGLFSVFFATTGTVMQQTVSAIIFVSAVISFLGGAILFSLGDACRLLKEIKKELKPKQNEA